MIRMLTNLLLVALGRVQMGELKCIKSNWTKNSLLVKNELYTETMMDLFDHTMLLYYENMPLIYSWAMSIGSNRNLLHLNETAMDKWKDIPTVLEGFNASPENLDDHFKLVHEYTRNDARSQGKCDMPTETSSSAAMEDTAGEDSAGILFIMEAENASRLSKLELPMSEDGTLFKALQEAGVTPRTVLSTTAGGGKTLATFFMLEGVVVARTWPDEDYCAFDIQLWSAFDKLDTIIASLTKAVGSEESALSSYRIITSGIQDAGMETTERENIGPPKILSHRNCDAPVLKEDGFDNTDVEVSLIEESLSMIQETSGLVAVVCGAERACASYNVVSEKESYTAISLATCPSIEGIEPNKEAFIEVMFACEIEVLDKLRLAVASEGKLDAFIVDKNVSENMRKFARVQTIVYSQPCHIANRKTSFVSISLFSSNSEPDLV